MSLFTIIRDWFVQYVWGGYASDGTLYNFSIGRFGGINQQTGNVYFEFSGIGVNNAPLKMAFGDWLSTTSTIITFVIILIFIGIFIHWCFKLVSGLILLRR